jgi:2-dehydropantoate 2-reductase
VRSPVGDTRLAVPVVERVGDLALTRDDVVVLAVKSQDTGGVLRDLVPAAVPDTPVVCLQNGVENERVLLRRFERVYGVPVMCPASHTVPGVVEAWSAPTTGLFDIGRYPAGVDDVCTSVAEALTSSTCVSEPRADVMRWKYAKLLMNLGNAVEALCRPSDGAVELARRARSEGAKALRAAGIDVATADEDRERRGNLLDLGEIDGGPRPGGSSYQSLARGTGSIEADALNGEIVLLGRLLATPTPVNALLQHRANRAAAAGEAPQSHDAATLLAELPDPD